MHRDTHTRSKHLLFWCNMCKYVYVYASWSYTNTQIFPKFVLLVVYCFMSLRLKFHKDPLFCWGVILLFVTLYIMLRILDILEKNCAKRHIRPLYVNFWGDIFFVFCLVPSVAQLSSASFYCQAQPQLQLILGWG